jgi:hypothetical protein
VSQVLQEHGPGPAAPLPPVRKAWYRRLVVIVPLTVAVVAAVVGVVFLAVRPSSSPAPSGTSPAVTASPPTTTTPPTATAPEAGTKVVSSRLAYSWGWPGGGATVTHNYPVPPVPKLVAIDVGDHPSDPGERPYNRMTFTFNTTFPSYDYVYVDTLVADGSGQPVPVDGPGILKVTFRQAQAHTDDGTASTITSQPARHFGYVRMVDYAQAGDYEGVLTYGIGVAWPIPQSNPQIPVRACEVEKVTAQGQHLYAIAIDVDARQSAAEASISVSQPTVRSADPVVISGVVPTSGERSCPVSDTLKIFRYLGDGPIRGVVRYGPGS